MLATLLGIEQAKHFNARAVWSDVNEAEVAGRSHDAQLYLNMPPKREPACVGSQFTGLR